ncbi:methyltransferase type 11 [Actinomycetospora sp. NBRC 106375]|uniref:class I SAM-dependent DNA methyltransferase n=1 Tax=Actinomycetospora sp. NBRC 106375 TaxID=3032207 RepID=UPI0024A28F0B|nr:class I SAM-dependent methyltransferase [Actinomycetospora sp. NBRC 106375]GLZ44207.1 methyltransferase type 11 [Actinomycetospora sp. NBRC 106375]
MDGATDVAERLALVGAATSVDDLRALYDAWAETYDDADVAAHLRSPAPAAVAAHLATLVDPRTEVLDAACGTGLVGAALAERGFRSVDGLDLSPMMVRRARRRRVYTDLGPADLRDDVPGAGEKFGAVTCAGGLAPGHLGPRALVGFLRVLRPGGVLVAGMADETWALGYELAVDRLVAGGYARPVDDVPRPSDGPGRLLVLEAREVPGPGRSVAWRS